MSQRLDELRGQIDRIDREIVRLFKERMSVAGEIAALKEERGLPVYMPQREAELFAKLEELSGEEFSEYTLSIFREIVTFSKEYQEGLLNTSKRIQLSENDIKSRNILLIGMAGCGKTTIGQALSERIHRKFADTDIIIEKQGGRSVREIFTESGESEFRRIEHQVLTELSSERGIVIATGGGAVTVSSNYLPIRRNSLVVWLQRDLDKLGTEKRPIYMTRSPQEVYDIRSALYQRFSDIIVDNNRSIDDAVDSIISELKIK